MAQHFGSALTRPWALVQWGSYSTPGKRPNTAVAYLTDDCGEKYLGGLVAFYRAPTEVLSRWHFRYKQPRAFTATDVVHIFPNGKSRNQGPSTAQIRAARKTLPRNPDAPDAAR